MVNGAEAYGRSEAEARGAECWTLIQKKKKGRIQSENILNLDATLDVTSCLRCQLL
jgi:hypothetical protein